MSSSAYSSLPAVRTHESEKSKNERVDSAPYVPPFLTRQTDALAPSIQITTSPLSAERPKLTPPDASIPRGLSEYQYLKLMDNLKTITNGITSTVSKRIDVYKQQIVKINDQNIEKLKENAEKAATSNWWTTLKKMATALLSAISLGLGLSLIFGGGNVPAGAALVASGVLSIANFACSQAGVWDQLAKQLAHEDEEKRKKIGLIIQISIGVLCCALSLYGGTQAFAAKAINPEFKLFQFIVTAIKGGTDIGQGFAKGFLIRSDADLAGVQAALNIERIHLSTVTKWIEHFLAETKKVNKMASQASRAILEANQRVVQFNV